MTERRRADIRAATLRTGGRAAPIVTLFLMPAIIAELLYGSTPITNPTPLLPEILVYGSAALLIREMVRRRGGGWLAIVLLGIAFGVAEECVILQTSLLPGLFGMDPEHVYGRALGVNWVYLVFLVGYETVWAIVLPIQLVEVIFPDRRDGAWLDQRGLAGATILFVIGSAAAWYLWTHVALQRFPAAQGHQAPVLTVALALATVAVLMALVLGQRRSAHAPQVAERRPPRPWLVGVTAFLLGLAWLVLTVTAFGVAPSMNPVIPILLGLALAGGTVLLVRRWARGSDWRDGHRLALVFGAMVASMLLGFPVVGVLGGPVAAVGKLLLNLVAVALLAVLAFETRRRWRAAAGAIVRPSAQSLPQTAGDLRQ